MRRACWITDRTPPGLMLSFIWISLVFPYLVFSVAFRLLFSYFTSFSMLVGRFPLCAGHIVLYLAMPCRRLWWHQGMICMFPSYFVVGVWLCPWFWVDGPLLLLISVPLFVLQSLIIRSNSFPKLQFDLYVHFDWNWQKFRPIGQIQRMGERSVIMNTKG